MVDADNPQICLCATDTASTVAPGFAMLGNRTLESLVDEFDEQTTSAALDPEYHEWFVKQHRADVPDLLEQVATASITSLFSALFAYLTTLRRITSTTS